MNIFRKLYLRWVCGIDPKFNPKLLNVPIPDLKYMFIQPERLNPEASKLIMHPIPQEVGDMFGRCDSPNSEYKQNPRDMQK